MAIGERIKQARRVAGLSLRDAAERADVSAQAISKYERGLDVPSSGVLLRLAPALGGRPQYFLPPPPVPTIVPKYRKRSTLPRRHEVAVLGKIQDWLERYLEIEDILELDGAGVRWPEGFPYPVRSVADAERAADALRSAWALGLDPIE